MRVADDNILYRLIKDGLCRNDLNGPTGPLVLFNQGELLTMSQPIVCAGLFVLISTGILGQPPASPAFEVATIRVAAPTSGGGRTATSGDRVVYNNTTLSNALGKAFQVVSGNQIVGPSWIFVDRYDISAKMPENTPKEMIPQMLQGLLIERFKLLIHHENRELPAYALVTGKGRLKLVKDEDENNRKNFIAVTNGQREAKGWSMANLAQMASLTLRLPVLDMTGIEGHYDFPYDYSLEETGSDSWPSIFTVVADLGLRLEARKAPFDVFVVDSGKKIPSEN
jgi:uncharacterized protein (TIGR03435 family)